MNSVDMIIIGAVGLGALIGLKIGFLKPASGIGGFALAVFIAVHNYAAVAMVYSRLFEGELMQLVAAFGTIVVGVTVAVRLIGHFVKKLLMRLVLGWVDHVAGMLGAATVTAALIGTVFFVIGGIGFVANSSAFTDSKLVSGVSKASFISTSTPWCSSLPEEGVKNGQPCTSMIGFAGDVTGMDIQGSMDDVLAGQDLGMLVDVVKGTLNGQSPGDIASFANQGLQGSPLSVGSSAVRGYEQ